MSYFEESATLPPPFNILPTPKLLLKMLGLRKKDKIRKMKMKVSGLYLRIVLALSDYFEHFLFCVISSRDCVW